MPSTFGFQPLPITPPDFNEFLQYQNSITSAIRQKLHKPPEEGKNDLKVSLFETTKQKSKVNNKNVKR